MSETLREMPAPSAPVLPPSLERHRELIATALRATVAQLPGPMRETVAYHLGGSSPRADDDSPGGDPSRVVSAFPGGKAIRPAIVLLACEAVGAPPEAALDGAVALELVHDFSLLHDDIMDGDRERRHRPTAWAVFGVPRALLAGDALVVLATRILLDRTAGHGPAAAEELCRATDEMIRGQCDDLAFERRLDMTMHEGLLMALRKTGALLGCAGALGAILGGGDAGQRDALRSFGRTLGLAFQAVDDVLGIWGDAAVTGKPVAGDLRCRKKSLPVLHALRLAGAPTERELGALLAGPEMREDHVTRALALLDAADSRGWTLRLAARNLGRALAQLEGCGLEQRAADDLRELAAFVVERQA